MVAQSVLFDHCLTSLFDHCLTIFDHFDHFLTYGRAAFGRMGSTPRPFDRHFIVGTGGALFDHYLTTIPLFGHYFFDHRCLTAV